MKKHMLTALLFASALMTANEKSSSSSSSSSSIPTETTPEKLYYTVSFFPNDGSDFLDTAGALQQLCIDHEEALAKHRLLIENIKTKRDAPAKMARSIKTVDLAETSGEIVLAENELDQATANINQLSSMLYKWRTDKSELPRLKKNIVNGISHAKYERTLARARIDALTKEIDVLQKKGDEASLKEIQAKKKQRRNDRLEVINLELAIFLGATQEGVVEPSTPK